MTDPPWRQAFDGLIKLMLNPRHIAELLGRLADFRRAFESDGLTIAEFNAYGATVRTLRQFIRANDDLEAMIYDRVLPDPAQRP